MRTLTKTCVVGVSVNEGAIQESSVKEIYFASETPVPN
jgi:hypothetical protein